MNYPPPPLPPGRPNSKSGSAPVPAIAQPSYYRPAPTVLLDDTDPAPAPQRLQPAPQRLQPAPRSVPVNLAGVPNQSSAPVRTGVYTPAPITSKKFVQAKYHPWAEYGNDWRELLTCKRGALGRTLASSSLFYYCTFWVLMLGGLVVLLRTAAVSDDFWRQVSLSLGLSSAGRWCRWVATGLMGAAWAVYFAALSRRSPVTMIVGAGIGVAALPLAVATYLVDTYNSNEYILVQGYWSFHQRWEYPASIICPLVVAAVAALQSIHTFFFARRWKLGRIYGSDLMKA